MDLFKDLILAVASFGASIWGLIILIRLLNTVTDKDRFEKWLDFIKVFLGTFVIGLLGYFAKLSFDNRNLAILESEQIGKYVEQAMEEDLEVRLRFADYFHTVLPKNRNTGWEEYYNELKEEHEIRNKKLDTMAFLITQRENLDSTKFQDYEKLTLEINKAQAVIKSSDKISGSQSGGQAAIIDASNDFVTCTRVKNSQPYGVSDRLLSGRVYAFSRIFAPKAESITINWRDENKNLLPNGTKSYPITRNESSGYRLSTWKNIYNPGNYTVEILNETGTKIGVKNFEIYQN